MAPMYYRNANAALIVFDITQYDTFDAMKTWVKGKFLIAELSE
jgi:Ras-related protein Rab-21